MVEMAIQTAMSGIDGAVEMYILGGLLGSVKGAAELVDSPPNYKKNKMRHVVSLARFSPFPHSGLYFLFFLLPLIGNKPRRSLPPFLSFLSSQCAPLQPFSLLSQSLYMLLLLIMVITPVVIQI